MKSYIQIINESKQHRLVNILQKLIDFHEKEKSNHSDAQKGLPVYNKIHQHNHNGEVYHRNILNRLYPALRAMEDFDSFGKKYEGEQ